MFGDISGVEEKDKKPIKKAKPRMNIIAGPINLLKYNNCKIYDIVGRQLHNLNPGPGIYFIEIDGVIVQKVIKVK